MLYFVLFSPVVDIKSILVNCPSDDIFSVCKYLCDHNYFYSIGVYNEQKMTDELFSSFMKDPDVIIFPCEFNGNWSFK